ncbi:N-acetyl sugar amidotransferase [uncultured Sphingomonas sp.]|uniref:N-acetyl sugar amidotransferase n=1 Tax=uncultured Sphingomonas sp. TaxID=158754 RepID=UPI00258709C6|nr:N-acetyl sugar amidotransferase [uncultured Sphingomonas sp.]
MSAYPGNHRVCTRCIMDTTAADITFDADGVCNYCTDFLERLDKYVEPDPAARERRLAQLVEKVRADGKGKPYDCIIGVSGGVDSSYTLVKAKELGLRPLAVHMDSGWNAEVAANNIANLVRGLGVDLYTHVIDWPEIRGLMEAMFAADVRDVEVLYDNALAGVVYGQAAKHGLRYILAGSNMATEGMAMPGEWTWNKLDKRNIVGISRKFGGPKLKTFPALGTYGYIKHIVWDRAHWIAFLDYIEYRKDAALAVLTSEYGYKPYAYKHYESVFTRFWQGYMLPMKCGYDKRKPHLSTLVMTGQMTRDEAVAKMHEIAYPSQKDLDSDRQYFLKKMGWTQQKLDDYLARPEIPHDAYPSEAALFQKMLDLYRRLNLRVGRVK